MQKIIEKSLLSLDETLSGTGGKKILSEEKSQFWFGSVATDSRNVRRGSLFVPLIGEFQDGHAYIEQALSSGATAVFVREKSYTENKKTYETLAKKNPSVTFIAVENTLTALQNLAGIYVKKFPNLLRVSVTGSSGKTTTKELAAAVLRQKFNVFSNRGNLNSETGLPLSCFEIRQEHEVAILEMGMNRENEIGELARTFRPNFAVITNIGTAHIGLLGNRDKIAAEKKKIFDFVGKDGVALIPADDDYAEFLSEGVNVRVVFYGENQNDAAFVKDAGVDGTFFEFGGETVHLKLPGKYNYKNALGAAELGRVLGLGAKEIKAGIESVSYLEGRSRIRKGKLTVLEDCYNANPDSMEKALAFASDVKVSGKKIFILGEMLELGKNSAEEHKKIGADRKSVV